jgi:glutathione S-transferase
MREEPLRFYELGPSPNNTKLRMALRYKGVPFEVVPVDHFDRSPVVELSGQEATPVIADRGIVLNDSEAILQYLDANYPDAPRLFPPDRAGRQVCCDWKRETDKRLARSWMPLFHYCIKMREDLDTDAQQAFRQALRWVEGEIGEDGTVRGADKPVCDIRVAEWATYALPGEGLLQRVPLFKRFREVFAVDPEQYPRLVAYLAPWNERLA